jgi:hypothetical protein
VAVGLRKQLQASARVAFEARQLPVMQAYENFFIEAVGMFVAAGVLDGRTQDGAQGRFLLSASRLRATSKTGNS